MLKIRQDGPIIGAIWKDGKVRHVCVKLKIFDEDEDYTHSNLVSNPK